MSGGGVSGAVCELTPEKLQIGSVVRIDCQGLGMLIAGMARRGYQVIGPRIQDSAIGYGPIQGIDDLPIGWTDEQGAGSYRLKRRSDAALFAYAVGPKSLKNFLHPSEIKLFSAERESGAFRILEGSEPAPRYAFLGVRACELAAAGVQDRVLMEDRYRDPVYSGRRRQSIVIAVECSHPSSACFCTSMGTGPRVRSGFDVALTELIDSGSHEFAVEIGTEVGAELVSECEYTEASPELLERARGVLDQAERGITRRLDTSGLAPALRENFNHPHWDAIAQRCLTCGNCTSVCPTCFCVTVEDTSAIGGTPAERWRKWDSCFTLGFSYIHGGSVRVSAKSRYRQWLTHKLSYWHDQFGGSGCVGCGRCTVWCPAAIDFIEEIAAIRAVARPDPAPGGAA